MNFFDMIAESLCSDCKQPMKEHPKGGCAEFRVRMARTTRIMNGMRRHDGADDSTLHCPCGESFEWSGISDALDPWLLKHESHVP